jgi:hypothetical protein
LEFGKKRSTENSPNLVTVVPVKLSFTTLATQRSAVARARTFASVRIFLRHRDRRLLARFRNSSATEKNDATAIYKKGVDGSVPASVDLHD